MQQATTLYIPTTDNYKVVTSAHITCSVSAILPYIMLWSPVLAQGKLQNCTHSSVADRSDMQFP